MATSSRTPSIASTSTCSSGPAGTPGVSAHDGRVAAPSRPRATATTLTGEPRYVCPSYTMIGAQAPDATRDRGFSSDVVPDPPQPATVAAISTCGAQLNSEACTSPMQRDVPCSRHVALSSRRRIRAVSAAAPDRNLALELVRVTESAAMAAAAWVGRGQKEKADQAAVDAMRLMLG